MFCITNSHVSEVDTHYQKQIYVCFYNNLGCYQMKCSEGVEISKYCITRRGIVDASKIFISGKV